MRSDEKRRLRLNRETLRVLDRDALAGVAAGFGETLECVAMLPKSNGWSRGEMLAAACTAVKI